MKTQKKAPNIVLMVSDDHGREALGCYGNPVIKTSHLDELAGDGVRFTNAFCTSASCAASRSVILTGLQNHTTGTYGHTHGVHHFTAFDWVKSLPVRLNAAGYRTGRVGKKHFAPDSVYPFRWGMPEAEFGRDDVSLSSACTDFISADGTFFLYWCSHDPHRDERLLENHPCKPNRFGNPDQPFPNDEEIEYSDAEVIVPPFLSDTPEVRAELAQYYQAISRLDRGIGRLIEILKKAGKYDNTLIIYISDNGAAFPGSKTTLYDPGMRLPCIIRSPLHHVRGGTSDALITWADITPTILDLAGVSSEPNAFFGDSLRDVIDEASPTNWREEIYAAHSFHEITNYYPMRIVRTKRHKFIWNIAHPLTFSSASDIWQSASWNAVCRDASETFGVRAVDAYLHRPKFELYDLENDPDEIVNLAGRKDYLPMVEEFTEKLKAFQTRTRDPWLHKWKYE